MSVYKPAKSRFWQYDFVLKGHRFYGSTGQASRRSAEVVERQRRLEAATGALGAVATLTLNEAAGRWWAEKGITRGDDRDVERRVSVLLEIIGKDTPLGEINQAEVAKAIEVRRGRLMKRGAAKNAKSYSPSPATVNRDIIETLRPILKRARTHWTAKSSSHGLPDIDWRELRLPEPRPVSRLYGKAERAAWIEACTEEVRLPLELLLTYGLRFNELFFHPNALDLEAGTLSLQKGRKRDVILLLPIRADHIRRLAPLVSRAQAAGLEQLWFRPIGKRLEPLTYGAMEYWISKAADRAEVKGHRRIHGARHHAGSTILARTNNLKAVQGLLGHASINSSQRYAHVAIEDLRAALEDEPPRYSPEPNTGETPQDKVG